MGAVLDHLNPLSIRKAVSKLSRSRLNAPKCSKSARKVVEKLFQEASYFSEALTCFLHPGPAVPAPVQEAKPVLCKSALWRPPTSLPSKHHRIENVGLDAHPRNSEACAPEQPSNSHMHRNTTALWPHVSVKHSVYAAHNKATKIRNAYL